MQADASHAPVADRAATLVEMLTQYSRSLQKASLNDKEAFHLAIIGAQDVIGMTQQDIAREFKCALGTVNRWSQGRTAPHPVMRKVIFDKLHQRTIRHLRRLGITIGPEPSDGSKVHRLHKPRSRTKFPLIASN